MSAPENKPLAPEWQGLSPGLDAIEHPGDHGPR